jgi:Fe-S-cluster-containing dehydrogenase component/DMSO reductase anchor subunit
MDAPRQAPSRPGAGSLDAYLAELLADQQQLVTPAARAAATHDVQPAGFRGDQFRDLIPLTAPRPGERYAFEVDLDACSGCKACVTACHSLNGLDEDESFRDVGLVLSDPPGAPRAEPCSAPFAQTVTTACHHCAEPACMHGCPVLAYEQDPATGIVRHLDDQCIGCSYCVLKCPYEVPKYNQRLGIVRKCDLCQGRLAAGEAPACAQACPTRAIRVVTISSASPATPSPLLHSPAVPPPSITGPTTRYVSRKPLPPTLRASDSAALRVQPAHWPLVLLLVGTQLSLGLLLAAALGGSQISNLKSQISAASAALFAAALGASVVHLGQPLRAWRVFLGLRRSWLSREAVALGAAFPLVVLVGVFPFLSALPLSATVLTPLTRYETPLALAALVFAAGGIFCSAMLYIDTRRHFWRPSNTVVRMAGTVLVGSLAFSAPPLAALALTIKIFLEIVLLRASPISAHLHAGPLLRLHRLRQAVGAGAIILCAASLSLPGFFLFALGEILERVLYFRGVDAPKMPGVPGGPTFSG